MFTYLRSFFKLHVSLTPHVHTHKKRLFHGIGSDVPDLVRVAVVAPLGRSDHSSLSAPTSMAQAIPNLGVSRRVLLKHRVNGLQFVMQQVSCEYHSSTGEQQVSADNPVERLKVHLSLLCMFCSDVSDLCA